MKLRAVLLISALLCLGVSVTGAAEAATASWSLEPSSFDFGFRPPADGPSAPQAFELRNTGETPLTPELISIVGRSAGFELAGDGCDHRLEPGTGCTIEVTFDPGGEGKKEGTLTVDSQSSPAGPATAQLLGSGGEPMIVVDPPAVFFDPVTITTATLPGTSQRTVTVSNVGSADLFIESIGYREEANPHPEWPNFDSFGSPIGPGLCVRVTIPPGGSCAINLDFSPETPGTYSAQIEVEDANNQRRGSGPRMVIPLYGSAVAAGAASSPPPGPLPASLPVFSHRPPRRTTSRTATFVFSAESSLGGIQCLSIRRRPFQACTSPTHLRGLKPGRHVFSVRAIAANGAPGPVATYHWRIVRRVHARPAHRAH